MSRLALHAKSAPLAVLALLAGCDGSSVNKKRDQPVNSGADRAQCKTDEQCQERSESASTACRSGRCVAIECLMDEDCPGLGRCDPARNTCWQCADNSDCTRGFCSGNHHCETSPCTLWDSVPPEVYFGNMVATAEGFAISDADDVYTWSSGRWTHWPAAIEGKSVIEKLIAGADFIAAATSDGAILRSSEGSLKTIGKVEEVSAIAAFESRLWVADGDGRLHVHDGSAWAEAETVPGAILAMAESSQGLLVATRSGFYVSIDREFRRLKGPSITAERIAPAASGELFVLGYYTAEVTHSDGKLYRVSGEELVEDQPCKQITDLIAGTSVVAVCGDKLFYRTADGRWMANQPYALESRAAVVLGPDDLASTLNGLTRVRNGVATPVPRTASGLPVAVAALGGYAGRDLLIGGTGGVYRVVGDSFVPIPGTLHLEVRALWEDADEKLVTLTGSALKRCTRDAECGPYGKCDDLCRAASDADTCKTGECPQGMSCATIHLKAASRRDCTQDVELHQTVAGTDSTMRVMESEGGTGGKIYGLDDGTGRLFVISSSNNLEFFDGSAWTHGSVHCGAHDSFEPVTAFVAPDVLLGHCIEDTQEFVASAVGTDVSRSPVPVQLTDPLSVLLRDGSKYQIRSTAGEVPIELPVELKVIGGTPDKLVAYDAAAKEFRYQSEGDWKSVVLPSGAQRMMEFWSSDGWATLYAISAGGGLLRCPLP